MNYKGILLLASGLIPVSGYGMSDSEDSSSGGSFSTTEMLSCATTQAYNQNKDTHSSNYCSFNGRYVLKGHWNNDTDKTLVNVSDYATAVTAMDALNGGYRLPTVQELSVFVNYTNTADVAPFSSYDIVENWYKTGAGSSAAYVSGYIATSTEVGDDFLVLDLANAEIKNILKTATNTTPPLYVLGISPYFQIVSMHNKQKCMAFDTQDAAVTLADCNSNDIKQRWRKSEISATDNFTLINQYVATASLCFARGDTSTSDSKAVLCEASPLAIETWTISDDDNGLVSLRIKSTETTPRYITSNDSASLAEVRTETTPDDKQQRWTIQF